MENIIQVLRLTSLFKGLSYNELLSFCQNKKYKITEYKKNGIIHFESEKCMSLDIILEGEIIVQKIDEKGNVLTITQFDNGDNIGGNLLFSNYPFYPMSIIAKTNCTLLHINGDAVLDLCQNNKEFLLEFIKCISDKTSILTSKIKSISLKSIRESIIDFLKYEYISQKNATIELKITKKDLAERLGIQRTSLSRELNKMRNDGLICYDAHSITIKDMSILNRPFD